MFSRSNPIIYIRNESNGFMSDGDITSLIPAVQRQVTEHFQPVWGYGAQLIFAKENIPPDAYEIVVYETARDEADAGYLGYHFSPDGYPVAAIFARDDIEKDRSISVTLSHEVLEMLIDPACNLYAYRPSAVGRPERIYFYEVCDAVQCVHYDIDGVNVCDFVHPEWFEHNWPAGSRKFDHCGRVERPFQVLRDCYASVYEAKRGSFVVWGSGEVARRGNHRSQVRKNGLHFGEQDDVLFRIEVRQRRKAAGALVAQHHAQGASGGCQVQARS